MDGITLHRVKKIQFEEAKHLEGEDCGWFWIRRVNITKEDGEDTIITMFADSPEKLAL